MIIADSLPEAEIWAVELSAAMRTRLLRHLALRADLHDRVTVIPTDVASGE